MRDDEGIVPYADGRFLPLNLAQPMLLGVPSTPVPGFARSTLSKQERAFCVLLAQPLSFYGLDIS